MLDTSLAERTCPMCGASIVSRRHHAKYCSDSCRYKAKNQQLQSSPELREQSRVRMARWYNEHRLAVRDRKINRHRAVRQIVKALELPSLRTVPLAQGRPYLFAAPAPGGNIPGGAFEIHATPPLRWPIEHRHARVLHGAITAVMSRFGVHHDPNIPEFALIPWSRGIGWALYVRNEACAREMAGRGHEARIYEQSVTLTFGPIARLKWPSNCPRQRSLIRLDAVTPIIVRANGRVDNANGSRLHSGNLHSTLTACLPQRVNVAIAPETVRTSIVKSDNVQQEKVPLHGKFGVATGWVGSWVVECNAPGLWLLRLAASIGLGGKVAFGFGRVRVTNAG